MARSDHVYGVPAVKEAELERLQSEVAMILRRLADVWPPRPAGQGSADAQCITAKLIAQDGADQSKYSWQQETRTTSGWTPTIGGLSGTTSADPAYQLDESATTDISDTHVVLSRVPMRDVHNIDVLGWIIISSVASGECVSVLSGIEINCDEEGQTVVGTYVDVVACPGGE
jgi:hypothetical protein